MDPLINPTPALLETRLDFVLQWKLWKNTDADNSSTEAFYTKCWNFTGRKTEFGHGVISHRGKNYFAHRLAYEFAHGPIPEGLVIRHACDNPACVFVGHLSTGTPRDNALDAVLRGRNPKGESHGMAKLTAQTVREIRWLFEQCGAARNAIRAIATRYNESKVIVRHVVTRGNWADLPDDFESLNPKPEPLSEQELERVKGDNFGGSPLKDADIQKIRALRTAGMSLATIAAIYDGLSPSTVSMICSGHTWKHVAPAPDGLLTKEELVAVEKDKQELDIKGRSPTNATITEEQVREIKYLLGDTGSRYGLLAKIADRYGIAKHIVASISKGTSWTSVKGLPSTLPEPVFVESASKERKQADYLADAVVQQIRAYRRAGFTYGTLSTKFAVGLATVAQICTGRSYVNVPDGCVELSEEDLATAELEKKKAIHTASLTDEQVRGIKHLLATTTPHYGYMAKIARRYEVELHIIQFINKGSTYKHITGAPAVLPAPLPVPTLANPPSTPQSP